MPLSGKAMHRRALVEPFPHLDLSATRRQDKAVKASFPEAHPKHPPCELKEPDNKNVQHSVRNPASQPSLHRHLEVGMVGSSRGSHQHRAKWGKRAQLHQSIKQSREKE